MRDLVAVGASAGGVEALRELVASLPGDLHATVLVGLHLSSQMPSVLAHLLQRRTPLEVLPAEDGMDLKPGRVIVSVPDRHLLVVEDKVVLGHGARENSQRPSHDAMMRSAALLRGERAVGVVMTGLLDDGSAGLSAINRYGGACLVQDPDDCAFPAMPRNALRAVPHALAAPLSTLAEEVVRMTTDDPRPVEVSASQRAMDHAELASALGAPTVLPDGTHPGHPSPFACPDCHGVLNQVPEADLLRYRCRTGHAWTAESLVAQQDASVEEAIWTALRALEERADMSHRLAERSIAGDRPWSTAYYTQRGDEAERSASTLRDLLARTSVVAHPPEP
jgi:two-component system chemotaxis response regulator CheB